MYIEFSRRISIYRSWHDLRYLTVSIIDFILLNSALTCSHVLGDIRVTHSSVHLMVKEVGIRVTEGGYL